MTSTTDPELAQIDGLPRHSSATMALGAALGHAAPREAARLLDDLAEISRLISMGVSSGANAAGSLHGFCWAYDAQRSEVVRVAMGPRLDTIDDQVHPLYWVVWALLGDGGAVLDRFGLGAPASWGCGQTLS